MYLPCHNACAGCTESYKHLLLVLMKFLTFRSACRRRIHRLSTSGSVLQQQDALSCRHSSALAPTFLNPHLSHGICCMALVLYLECESDLGKIFTYCEPESGCALSD